MEASDVGDIDEDKAGPSSAAYERPTHVTGGMQATGPHPIATMTMTGPREGQSVEPAPSDEEEIAVRVAVSVQRALTGTPLISIDLDLRDSIETVRGAVSYALYPQNSENEIVDPQRLKILHGELVLEPKKTLAEISSELGHPPVLELGMVQEVGA